MLLSQEQFVSSILYSLIGDAFAMPMDGVHPNYLRSTYPQGFSNFEPPAPISKNNKLVAGSITDIGGTIYMIMEMLLETDTPNEFYFTKYFNKLLRYSNTQKIELEANYQNFASHEFTIRPGLTNITRALPYTLTHLSDEQLKEKLLSLNNLTHIDKRNASLMLYHNMLLKDLAETKSLHHSMFNCLEYLESEKDKANIMKVINEYQANRHVDLSRLQYLTVTDNIEDNMYANYIIALASSLNTEQSLLERFLYAIYMGGATSFACSIIGSIHGILSPDIEYINDAFLERLHYGNEVRIIDFYDLSVELHKKYM